MILKTVQVTDFHSIRDTNEFEVGDITCLVGKNEAGKTAILEALKRLNPVSGQELEYSITDDYPRKDVEDYRCNVETGKVEPANVVIAKFELEDREILLLEEHYGTKAIKDKYITLKKGYSNEMIFIFSLNEKEVMQYIISKFDLPTELTASLKSKSTILEIIEELKNAEQTEGVKELMKILQPMSTNGLDSYVFNTHLKPLIPQFLYFDEYYQLKGRDNIQKLKERLNNNALEKSDYPLLGLINLARLDLDTLLNPGRTIELKNRLEGAGNHLTKQIVKYWTQNKHLQMRFDVRPAQPQDPSDMRTGINIWAEVYDNRHWVSTGLETRSRGFVWFFSFLAWYSDLKKEDKQLILLLDEPGLFLHAKAQEDLLRYFDAEIKGTHQLLYTTHSPFMVDPKHFDRVRIIQDSSIDSEEEMPIEKDGTKVLTEVLEASTDSLFPLQGALGYEIYQTLFVGPNCLAVEGVSDLLFIQGISSILEKKGKEGLDKRWTITPVGGSDKIPTFVALLGSQNNLNIAVLMDYQKKDQQMIENLYKEKLMKKKNVITFANFTKTREADIEDMFNIDLYLDIVNNEYKDVLSKPISANNLENTNPRVVIKLESFFEKNPMNNRSYNHYAPARCFIERLSYFEKKIDEDTLLRFEECFKHLNKLL